MVHKYRNFDPSDVSVLHKPEIHIRNLLDCKGLLPFFFLLEGKGGMEPKYKVTLLKGSCLVRSGRL